MGLESRQLILVRCDKCGEANVLVERIVPAGNDPARAYVPHDWIQYGELTFCPKHDIQIVVDGERPTGEG
jgi:hypothetical protein